MFTPGTVALRLAELAAAGGRPVTGGAGMPVRGRSLPIAGADSFNKTLESCKLEQTLKDSTAAGRHCSAMYGGTVVLCRF